MAILCTQLITSTEADLLGTLRELQLKIRDQLSEAHTKVQSPPPIDNILALLRKEFDQDEILIGDGTDIESDSNLSDADCNKTPRELKKKVKYGAHICFTVLLPPTAMSLVPFPPREVSRILQLHQGQAQAMDVKDSGRADTEGDAETSECMSTVTSPLCRILSLKSPLTDIMTVRTLFHTVITPIRSLGTPIFYHESESNIPILTQHHLSHHRLQLRTTPRRQELLRKSHTARNS